MPKQKEERYEVAGKRLKIARTVMGKTQEKILDNERWVKTVDIADAKTIGLWEREGVPENKLEKLADFLNITQFLLTDPKIEDVAFRKIIELRKSDDNANIDHLFPSESIKDGSDRISDENELEKAIAAYHQKVKKQPRFRGLEKMFTSMELIESPELAKDTVFDLDEDWSDDEDLWENEEIDKPIRKGTIFEIMDIESQIVLLGEPGIGKTTCLQWKFVCSVKEYQPSNRVLIYVPLSKYRPGISLMDLICHISNIRQEYLLLLLGEDRLILLLDGFNECPIKYQDSCLGQMISFLTRWPDISLVLTSRTRSWRKELEFPVFTVHPLSLEKQIQFLGAYLEDTKRAEDIFEQIHAQPGGEVIAKNPWMLFMISEITRERDDLPRGRALMYRRYVKRWYEREFKKARHSRPDLPWTEKQVFDDLSLIATHMRINGYTKEAPLSWVIDVLGNSPNAGQKTVDFLGQGMICSASQEDDSFSFLHETLQEYLSAEYVLTKFELLGQITGKESSAWDMVLAYAFELQKNPHEKFVKAAWILNPLITVFVVENTDVLKSFPPPKVSPFLEDVIQFFLREKWQLLNDNEYRKFPVPERLDLSILRNLECQYIFKSNSIAHERLKLLKKDLFNRPLIKMYGFVDVGFLQRSDVTKQIRNELIAKILRWRKRGSLIMLIKNDWVIKEDFIDRVPEWIEAIDPHKARTLIRKGIATREDFIDRVPEWIKTVDPYKARTLIEKGIATREDFIDRVPVWIETADPGMSKFLIKAGLATKEDFIDKVSAWIEKASPRKAKILIEEGFATKEDFIDKASVWIEQVGPRKAIILIEKGIATKEAFIDRVPVWVETASPYYAKILVEEGLATKEAFIDRVPEWIETVGPNEAKTLITDLVTRGDFTPGFLDTFLFEGRISDFNLE